MVSKVWVPKVDILNFTEELQAHYRLLAYVFEFCGPYEFKPYDHNGYVYYGHENSAWVAFCATISQTPGVVYMPQEVAVTLAEKLNSGEVTL
jgi:hypothetical protein